MEIIELQLNNQEQVNEFIEFLYDHYKDEKGFVPPFKRSLKDELNPAKNPFFSYGTCRLWVAKENGKIKGRVAAFTNNKMDEATGKKIGMAGMFECVEHYETAKLLLDTAINSLQENGCTTIFGPMNGSIWANYRFRVDQFDEEHPHFGELYNKRYYPEFFEKYGFKPIRKWLSRRVDLQKPSDLAVLEKRMPKYKQRYDGALELGYTMDYYNPENFDKNLKDIYRITMASFVGHSFFYSLSFDEFLFRFGGLKMLLGKEHIIFAYKNGEMVAFGIVCNDYGKALNAMQGKTTLLSKIKFLLNRKTDTINHLFSALLPEHVMNRSGLTSACFYGATQKMYKRKNVRYVVHPLMYEGNRSGNYSEGMGELIATSVLYELNPAKENLESN